MYNQQDINEISWLKEILEEAVRLGLKHQLPTSQVAGFVFGAGACEKLLKKNARADVDARFAARMATPEYAAVPRKFKIVGR